MQIAKLKFRNKYIWDKTMQGILSITIKIKLNSKSELLYSKTSVLIGVNLNKKNQKRERFWRVNRSQLASYHPKNYY